MTELPKISRPAQRALDANGIQSLEQLARWTEAEVKAMHGVGPSTLVPLREALEANGLTYRSATAKAPRGAKAAKPAAPKAAEDAKAPRAAKPAARAAPKDVKPAAKTAPKSEAGAKRPRVYAMSFKSVYPLYVEKAERKGRTKAEVDEIIAWLTGYRGAKLQRVLDSDTDLETFYAKAPQMNPNTSLITGLVCGVRVENVEDPVMQKIRYLDKLIDELARGKKLESILRH